MVATRCSLASAHSQEIIYGDIVINEVLFNPPGDGYDYIEGYNRSNKTIDLRELYISKRNPSGEISGQKQISRDSFFLPPGSYFVITSNEKWLRQYFGIPVQTVVCQVSSLPSFPDTDGTVIFLTAQDSIIDELSYSDKWHFSLITDPSGVSLERINYDFPTQDSNNWTSAAASSHYGTPGYQNSQYQDGSHNDNEIVVPHLFSPDNDGINDIELIQFKMKEQGFIVNSIIYDISGRKVKYLLKNESVGSSAMYKWDGLDEKFRALPQGIYIIVTEMFNLKGKTKKFKNSVVLAKR
jgi:hypothetical protein